MDQVFTSTRWRDCTRNILVNNERILYVEQFEGECVTYLIVFDNGQTIDLDEQTGKMFCRQLEQLNRPSPPVRYEQRDYRDRLPPRIPRRIRGARPVREQGASS